MNNQTKRWEIIGESIKGNKGTTSIKGILDKLLKNRGIKTEKEKKEFFNPIPPEKISVKSLSLNQKEINKAIKRIKKALKTREKVIIYGDYDADGICATAVLWECLYGLHLDVLPYIPERFSEGYGLNVKSIKKLKTLNPKLKLIITVDHGIVANEKIDIARELGVDVIITDHHLPRLDKKGKPVMPKAAAVVHTTKICGAAVAWVLAREISKKFPSAGSLDLVAIGTIADQIPLLGPNRSFAKYGLLEINQTKREGLKALMEEARIIVGAVGPYEVGFLIAPRINAMGRLTNAVDSLRLLCTKDKNKARDLAALIGRTNTERQRIVDEVVIHARGLTKDKEVRGVMVLAHESYHEGVIGLAAAKLVEEFYRPAIVLSRKKDISKASARSINGFNIIEAIRKLESLYIEGGGHPMAAGFSIETTKIEEFTKRINEVAQPLLTEEILRRRLKIDLETYFNQLNWQLFEKLKQFEPTGLGNPAPTFVTRKVNVGDARVVGRDGKHLKLRLRQNSVTFDAIAFGIGSLYSRLSPDSKIDIAYTLEEDTWNGNQKLQLKIKDLRIN